MKFYEFSAKTFQWQIILTGQKSHEVLIPLKKGRFVEEKELPLTMELIDSYEDINLWEGETPFVDILRWSSDFTLGGNCPDIGGGMSIISQRVKEVFEKYKLPPHRFYPVKMHSPYYKETRDNYFFFHMPGNGISDNEKVDYEKCTFEETKRNDDYNKVVVANYPEGTIKSREHWLNIKRRKDTEIKLGTYEHYSMPGHKMKNRLNFVNKVYKHDYDVLWGTPSLIYISEEIKKELETIEINNGNFYKTSENMIRAFEYQQGLDNES